jgi:primosomal protein N' (replication factor Y)
VLVQTFVPDHYALEPVLRHDYERFYRDEIVHRRSLGYPPFGHVALALVSSEDESEAYASAEALARDARDGAGGNAPCEIFGPSPAPLSRLRSRFRVQVLAKGDDAGPVREAARAFQRAALRLPKSVQVSVDAHATSML